MTIGLMLFFWTLADAILSYSTPILITNQGISESQMGLIYGTSSIFGAFIDFVLSKNVKNASYRRFFLIVFIIYILYPIIIWQANTVLFFLLCMLIWGLYYDLVTFGIHTFVSEEIDSKQHASGHAFISVFKSLGFILGPIIASYFVAENYLFQTQYIIVVLFIMGALFLLINWFISKKKESASDYKRVKEVKNNSLLEEIRSWLYVWKKIKYVLILVILFFAVSAVFWTIGPLLSKEFEYFPQFGGLLLAANILPPLYMSWLVRKVTSKYGKKRTAHITYAIYCLMLGTIGFIHNPYIILIIVLIAASIGSFSLPAIEGAIADYVAESKNHDSEIIGVYDFSTNIGYMIGPIFAGVVADFLGNMMTFTAIAIIGVFVSLFLLFVTPKSIQIETKSGGEFKS